MTERASFRQADLARAMREAAKVGWRVEIEGAVIRLLPTDPDAPLPSPVPSESDWQGKLAKWRRSK